MKTSQNDLLREHIGAKLDEKYNYGTASSTRADIEEFILKNKEFYKLPQNAKAEDITKKMYKAVAAAHSKMLGDRCKVKGIDPRSFGKRVKTPRPNQSFSDMEANITPEPSAGDVVNTIKVKDGQPSVQSNSNLQVAQDSTNSPLAQNFDVEGVGACFSALTAVLKMNWPEMDILTEDEKKSLGKMWLPAFQKYLTENWAIVGVPFIATLGLFMPKIQAARKKSKKKKSEEKSEIKEGNVTDLKDGAKKDE